MTGKEGHIPGESEAVAMINYDSEPSLRDLQGLMTVSRPGRLSDSDDHRPWHHVVLVSDTVSDWLCSPGPGPRPTDRQSRSPTVSPGQWPRGHGRAAARHYRDCRQCRASH